MDSPDRDPHPGSLRYKDVTGELVVAEPNTPWFSTAIMLATEFWDSKLKRWVPIWDDPLS